jgi:hypothetical protein
MLLHRPQPHAFKEKEPVDCSTPKDVFEHSPEELVDIALSELQAAGIQLIEWRALVNRRMDVPIVIRASGLSTPPPLIYTIVFFYYHPVLLLRRSRRGSTSRIEDPE